LAVKDVAAAGGWKDLTTLLEVYQQSDATSVLSVMSEPRKLHDNGLPEHHSRETAPETAPLLKT
jgi:hypothetical protein